MSGKDKLNITPRAQTLMELLAEELARCGYGDCYVTPAFEHGEVTSIAIRRDEPKLWVFAVVVDGEWHVGTSLDESGAEDDDR